MSFEEGKNNEKFIIKNVLDEISKPLKGLTLFTNPAGSGKSYETALMIADKIIRMHSGKEPLRKIYYITPRLKNLNDIYSEIRNALNYKGYLNLFDEVIKIDSFRNSVINNHDLVVNNKVTSKWKEARDLKDSLDIINDKNTPLPARKRFEDTLFNTVNNPEFLFRQKLSKEFKKDYKANSFPGESQYDFMIKGKWNFIEKLYPSSHTLSKTVFVLTSKKFFLKNDPVIAPSYFFTNKENIRDSLIIIDEIDAVKSDMIDIIMNNNFDNDVIDMFGIIYKVFQNIDGMDEHAINISKSKEEIKWIKKNCEYFKDKYFPEKWELRLFDSNNDGELEEVRVERKIMNYQGVHSYYDAKKNYKYVPYRSNDKKDIPAEMQCNKIISKNFIENENKESYFISEFLRDITWFLNKSFKIFYNMSYKYMLAENERIKKTMQSKKEPLINANDSVSTILGKLHFDRGNALKLAKYIISVNEYRRFGHQDKDEFEFLSESFYSRGLYYSCLSEFDEFRHTNILNNYELSYTPELMLLNLAYKAHIIGISATAEVESLNNFNIEFLKKGLFYNTKESLFYEISEKNRGLLKNDYKKKTKGYKDIKTKVIKIEVDKNSVDVDRDLAALFYDKNKVKKNEIQFIKNNTDIGDYFVKQNHLKEVLQGAVNNNSSEMLYDYERLKKVWKYILEVVKMYKKDKVISNGIITTMKLAKDKYSAENYKDIYTVDNIKLGALYICSGVLGIKFNNKKLLPMVESMFVTVNSNDLKIDELSDKKSEIFKNKFKNNELVFMLTSYASVSRGNNLQVKVGKDVISGLLKSGELIYVNNWENKGYLDWDSIYIEKPTYVIPLLKSIGISKEDSKEKFSHREKLEVLLKIEELAAHHQIGRYTKKKILKEFFDSFKEKIVIGNYYNSLYSLKSVKADYSILIYQTIGRISRTNLKKKYNAVFYDSELIYYMESEREFLNIPILTNEFERFLENISLEKENELNMLINKKESKFTEQNISMFYMIDTILQVGNEGESGWYDELRKLWEELRRFTLKYPVITKKELKNAKEYFKNLPAANEFGLDISDIYLKFSKSKNKYFYGTYTDMANEINDFKHVLVSNDNRINSKPSRIFNFEVSIDDCRLSMILNNEWIRNHWEKNGFNMDWGENRDDIYGILCPVIYTNIYKGAIGEEALKASFDHIGIKYDNIKDPFLYELFDFVVRDNNCSIYIDAKNFSEASLSKEYANEELLNKVNEKIKNVDYAYIINLIDETGFRKIFDAYNVISVPGIFKGKYLNDCRLIRVNDEEGGKSILEYIKISIDKKIKNKINSELLK